MNDEYVPECLRSHERRPRPLMFGIGEEHSPGQFGMWFGPHPSEKEMLDTVGMGEKSRIIRFNTDGTDDVLWRWENNRWIRMSPEV